MAGLVLISSLHGRTALTAVTAAGGPLASFSRLTRSGLVSATIEDGAADDSGTIARSTGGTRGVVGGAVTTLPPRCGFVSATVVADGGGGSCVGVTIALSATTMRDVGGAVTTTGGPLLSGLASACVDDAVAKAAVGGAVTIVARSTIDTRGAVTIVLPNSELVGAAFDDVDAAGTETIALSEANVVLGVGGAVTTVPSTGTRGSLDVDEDDDDVDAPTAAAASFNFSPIVAKCSC